jgi:hypothetical protein|tara:strand:- start:590 stop:1198 length:609 start_codon:yes stop_codon:yes gene_type:complete
MKESKGYQSIWIPLVFFLAVGAAFVGVPASEQPKQWILMSDECFDLQTDYDGDGKVSFIDDTSCQDYMYEDGNGQTDTPFASMYQNPQGDYQAYYDGVADLTKEFINKICNGQIANCAGYGGPINEIGFYCYFTTSGQIMQNPIDQIYYKQHNFNSGASGSTFDDGSLTLHNSLCNQIGGPQAGDLPTIAYQAVKINETSPN